MCMYKSNFSFLLLWIYYKSDAAMCYQSSKYMGHPMIKSCSLNSTTNNSKILQSLRKKTARYLDIKARNLRRETASQISSKIKLNHRTHLVLFNPIDNLYKLRSNISLKTAPPRGNVLAFHVQKALFLFQVWQLGTMCSRFIETVQCLLRFCLCGFFLHLGLRIDIAY